MSKYEIDQETGEVLLNHSTISAEDVVDRLNDLETKLTEKDKIITKYQLLDDNYSRLEEKYDLLESKHEVLIEENLKYEQQLEIYKKALTLAREYMFNVMCADDVPFENWFINCAKNNRKPS